MKNLLVALLISTLLLAFSTINAMSLKEKNVVYSKYVIDENLSSEDRISGFRFSDWKPLSDDYLIITTLRDNYLVETKGRCSGLSYAHNIQLHRSSNLSLNARADSITPSGRGSFNAPSGRATGRCLIESIYPITNIQADYLINTGTNVESES